MPFGAMRAAVPRTLTRDGEIRLIRIRPDQILYRHNPDRKTREPWRDRRSAPG
jgi:hypothetical protein